MKLMSKNKTLWKLFTDFWSVFSILYIFICGFVAIFAYVLAPDRSKNANTMHLSIHSKPPMFSVKILILPEDEVLFSFGNYFIGSELMLTLLTIIIFYTY